MTSHDTRWFSGENFASFIKVAKSAPSSSFWRRIRFFVLSESRGTDLAAGDIAILVGGEIEKVGKGGEGNVADPGDGGLDEVGLGVEKVVESDLDEVA